MENVARLKSIIRPLLDWYDKNARDLPWRRDPSPYRVWISEIMLQQTRVEAGRGYFLRWMEELPHVEALANAPEEKLMKLWQGLGYYNRARNLKKAACIIMEQYGGVMPDRYEELLTLPGIGRYTAGAVGSIAFGLPVAAVDGNVLRVVARLTADKDDIGSSAVKEKMEKLLWDIVPLERPGDFNQALMELGALICIPNGRPKCDQCPLSGSCEAHSLGIETDFPVKAPKKARNVEKKTILILQNNGKILLHKRDEKGLLAGLWEFPGINGQLTLKQVRSLLKREGFAVKDMEALPAAKHVFSHIEWHMAGFSADVESLRGDAAATKDSSVAAEIAEMTEIGKVCEEAGHYRKDKTDKKLRWVWADRQELKTKYALPSAFRSYMQFLTDAGYERKEAEGGENGTDRK